MDSYILLADSDHETLKLMSTALKYFYGGEVLATTSSDEAKAILEQKGSPELFISELDLLLANEGTLHRYLDEASSIFPVIASTDADEAEQLIKNFCAISGLIEKPLSVDAFTFLVKGMIHSPVISPSHVPIDIATALSHACQNFDIFLKLSGTNYVKIIAKDDAFSYLDAEKLMSKGIKEVHILSSDAFSLLRNWEKKLKLPPMQSEGEGIEDTVFAIEALEGIEKVCKALGWNKEVVEVAQQTINQAIVLLSKEVKLKEALRKRLSNGSSKYSLHVGLLSFLNCAFSIQLGWTKEAGQLKLVMASLLHDLALDDYYYQNIKDWNAKASDFTDKSPDTIKYRLHPLHASKLAHSSKILPPDVDQIILQHHERKDGSGFPRGLTYSRISHLSSLFIISEDFVDFILKGTHLETSIRDYLTWGEAYYDQGHFKKIFDRIKWHIQSSDKIS